MNFRGTEVLHVLDFFSIDFPVQEEEVLSLLSLSAEVTDLSEGEREEN